MNRQAVVSPRRAPCFVPPQVAPQVYSAVCSSPTESSIPSVVEPSAASFVVPHAAAPPAHRAPPELPPASFIITVQGVSHTVESPHLQSSESIHQLVESYCSVFHAPCAQFYTEALRDRLAFLSSQFQRSAHETAAVETSAAFQWPSDVPTRVLGDLLRCGSLPALIRDPTRGRHPGAPLTT